MRNGRLVASRSWASTSATPHLLRLAFQSQFKVPYPSIADTNATLAVEYRIPSAPALVFLNSRAKSADVVLGALGTMSVADFDAEITTLLSTSTTGSA